MNKNLSTIINGEMSKENFIEELESFRGTYTCVDIIGVISKLQQFENFDFYTYESERTFEEFLALGDRFEEDLDFKICLDNIQTFLQDKISGSLLLNLDNGLQLHIYYDDIL